VSGLSTIFVTRTQGFSWMFWKERPGIPVIIAFCVAQTAATILCAYGLNGFPNNGLINFNGSGWWYVLVAWIYFLIWCVLPLPLHRPKKKHEEEARAEPFLTSHTL